MDIYPLDQDLMDKERLREFIAGKVEIEGKTAHPIHLNNWIKKLNQYEWVEKAAIEAYDYKSKDKKGYFLINIEVKE